MVKDFGSRNVAGFEGLNNVPYKLADKDYQDKVETVRKFIEKIQKQISREEKHLELYQQDIKRSFYNEGWCSRRISALEDVLDCLIETVKE